MSSRELKNKPLVEAILEMRWELQGKTSGISSDPHYKLLPGRLSDKLQNQYPEHEQLDTVNIPDEMAGHIVQHQFRCKPKDWPLVQLGPGVLTINDTDKYKWEDYRARVVDVMNKLYESHPKPDELRVQNLTLRYIDAVEFDYENEDICQFLREKLKVSVLVPNNLFENVDVESLPQQFQLQQVFRSNSPAGIIQLRFATGQKANKPAVIWETMVQSVGDDLPNLPTGFEQWLDKAHALANDWFFKMIEGDLHRSFSNE